MLSDRLGIDSAQRSGCHTKHGLTLQANRTTHAYTKHNGANAHAGKNRRRVAPRARVWCKLCGGMPRRNAIWVVVGAPLSPPPLPENGRRFDPRVSEGPSFFLCLLLLFCLLTILLFAIYSFVCLLVRMSEDDREAVDAFHREYVDAIKALHVRPSSFFSSFLFKC